MSNRAHAQPWWPWLVWSFGPALFFYAWFQRVAPSIMIDQLMRDLAVSGAALVLGTASLAAIVWLSNLPTALLGALFIISGACYGTMIVSFAIARDSNAPAVHGATFGFLNGAVVGSGALFQPLLGALLDWQWDGVMDNGAPVYDAVAFRNSFSALLVFLCAGIVATLAIREPTIAHAKAGAARDGQDTGEQV